MSNHNNIMLCSACDSEIDTNKKRDLRSSEQKNNKNMCSKCSDISPAHIFNLLKNNLQNFDKVESRLINLEKIIEYVANSAKTLINNFNTIEQISEDIFKIFNKSDIIEEKCISGYNIIEELFQNFQKNNSSVRHSLETLADVSSRLEDNWISNPPTPQDQRDSHANSNDVTKCLQEISAISKKLDDLNHKKSIQTKTKILIKDVAIATDPIVSVAPSSIPNTPNCGWRLLGEKKVWKSNWSHYDEKMRSFKTAENLRTKKQKQKKQKRIKKQFEAELNKNPKVTDEIKETSNTSNSNFNRNSSLRRTFRNSATTNVQSLPSTTHSPPAIIRSQPDTQQSQKKPTNHEIKFINFDIGQTSTSILNETKSSSILDKTESSNFRFIDFQKGETLYPSNGSQPQQRTTPIIDPLITPTVNSTQISLADGNRYALSRLNNDKLYKIIRLYVAYLHEQPVTANFDGHTVISAKARIGSEGLPTDPAKLKKLLIEFNNRFDISTEDSQADLDALRNFCRSSKINELQRNKENFNKFYNLGTINGNKKNF